MAMPAVLGTAELLDCILEYLDPKTLLLAQCVNHQWHKATTSSPELQDKLFYTHRSSPRERTRYVWAPWEYRLADRLVQGTRLDIELPDHATLDTLLLTPVRLNPLLTEEILPLELQHAESTSDQGQWLESIPISSLLRSPFGSWRYMFISSPPATRIIARSVFEWPHDPPIHWTRGGSRQHRFVVEDPEGVRMSLVVDKVLEMAKGFAIGVEDLPKARLDHWRLACCSCIYVGDKLARFDDARGVVHETTDGAWLRLTSD